MEDITKKYDNGKKLLFGNLAYASIPPDALRDFLLYSIPHQSPG
jgi:hypothetical protein